MLLVSTKRVKEKNNFCFLDAGASLVLKEAQNLKSIDTQHHYEYICFSCLPCVIPGKSPGYRSSR